LLAALAELAALEAAVHLPDPAEPRGLSEARPDLDQARRTIAGRLSLLSEAALIVEPTDIDARLRRLGETVGLMDHCCREAPRWGFYSILVTPSGLDVHRSILEVGPDDFQAAFFLSPGRLLDAIVAGDPGDIQQVFSLPLVDDVWSEIAAAVLP